MQDNNHFITTQISLELDNNKDNLI